MKKIILIIAMLGLASCSWFSSAAPKVEAESCQKSFEATIASLNSGKSFRPLFDFYKDHSKCMDGAVAEGIEGAISTSLNGKWEQLPELKDLFADAGFKKFFFNNIECYVSSTEKDLEKVYIKAQSECPKGHDELCKELFKTVKAALEYAQVQ